VSDTKTCPERVSRDNGWNFSPCGRPIKSEDGYCLMHSPKRQAERKAKRPPTQWDREASQRRHMRKERAAVEDLVGLLEQHEDALPSNVAAALLQVKELMQMTEMKTWPVRRVEDWGKEERRDGEG